MKQNNVANLVMIIGVIIFILGGIGGFIAGDGIVVVWLSSFISGMFFIALAEIIELIDTKLEFANNRLSNLESLLISTSFVDENVIENYKKESNSTREYTYKMQDPILTNYEAQFIRDYYNNKQIKVLNIVKSPIVDHCLVQLETGENEIVELGGFKPIVKKPEEWGTDLRRWYDERQFT